MGPGAPASRFALSAGLRSTRSSHRPESQARSPPTRGGVYSTVTLFAGGEVNFLETLDPAAQWGARKALLRGAVPASLIALS